MKRLIFTVCTLALLGIFAFGWFRPNQVLQRRTRKFLHTLTLVSGSARSDRQLGIYALNGLLASQVELNAPPSLDEANGIFERSEIQSAFSWLCDQAKQTRFDLKNFHSVTITGDQAEAAFSLEALVELPSDRPVDGTYEVIIHWQKENKAWHIARVTWEEAGR